MEGGDDLVAQLDEHDRRALFDLGTSRSLPARAVLVHEGDPSTEAYLVTWGSVKVTRTSPDGREVVVGVRTPGELIGELGIVDGGPRSATVSTLEPTDVVVLPLDLLRQEVEQRPGLAFALLTSVVHRLRESTDQVLELGTQDALARVSRRLLEMSPNEPRGSSPAPSYLGVSQQDLAARCGLSREAVVKSLRTLRTLGWIEQEGRRVVVLDESALRERGGLEPDPA